MIAYLFWNQPEPAQADGYEEALVEFHRRPRPRPSRGSVTTATYRVSNLPWLGAEIGCDRDMALQPLGLPLAWRSGLPCGLPATPFLLTRELALCPAPEFCAGGALSGESTADPVSQRKPLFVVHEPEHATAAVCAQNPWQRADRPPARRR